MGGRQAGSGGARPPWQQSRWPARSADVQPRIHHPTLQACSYCERREAEVVAPAVRLWPSNPDVMEWSRLLATSSDKLARAPLGTAGRTEAGCQGGASARQCRWWCQARRLRRLAPQQPSHTPSHPGHPPVSASSSLLPWMVGITSSSFAYAVTAATASTSSAWAERCRCKEGGAWQPKGGGGRRATQWTASQHKANQPPPSLWTHTLNANVLAQAATGTPTSILPQSATHQRSWAHEHAATSTPLSRYTATTRPPTHRPPTHRCSCA